MQSFYPEKFERDMACTEAEWLMWLPNAVGDHPLEMQAGAARVALEGGELRMQWQAQAPRVIALVRLPRLAVRFEFTNVPEQILQVFMKRFDLYMQRGGG